MYFKPLHSWKNCHIMKMCMQAMERAGFRKMMSSVLKSESTGHPLDQQVLRKMNSICSRVQISLWDCIYIKVKIEALIKNKILRGEGSKSNIHRYASENGDHLGKQKRGKKAKKEERRNQSAREENQQTCEP